MSFRVWFKQWVFAFLRILTLGFKNRKSDAQRKKEREHRMKAKFSSARYFQSKKKRARPRSSLHVWFEKAMLSMIDFAAISFGILFLPFGLFDWGHKSIKARKASKSSETKKSTTYTQASKPTPSAPKMPTSDIPKKGTKPRPTSAPSTTVKVPAEIKADSTSTQNPCRVATLEDVKDIPIMVKKETPAELDENVPKSTPKNEKDQYIRKRMIIAGSSYCDKEVLDVLAIGTCFDVALEPENPYDKEAVKLTYNGQKIGYISRADKPAFVTCLKLKRKVYGVITDINTETFPTQYEFETWFDSNK